MATVSSVVSVHGVRSGHGLEWITSQLRVGVFDVSFGATENYVTGGISVSFPGFTTVLGAVRIGGDLLNYHVAYGGGKLQVYGQEPTNTTTGVIAFSELPNGSTVINNKTVRLVVIGK